VAYWSYSDFILRNALNISNKTVTVFGAYGHTGRFVVAELHKRGWKTILSGRDAAKLKQLAAGHPESEARVASVDDDVSLDRAMAGAGAVINCAGPFIDTAIPIIEAALRSGIHYFDVAAEQAAVLAVFERFSCAAKGAGVVIAPAMAFYGGLGDLLATAAMGDWLVADEILLLLALGGWKPTRGTRLTGERNPGPRFFSLMADWSVRIRRHRAPGIFPLHSGSRMSWGFLSLRPLLSRAICQRLGSMFICEAPVTDIRNPDTSEPVAADESGRSSQTFLMEVIARKGDAERRAVARGRDIYAVTAPIVVEAAHRVVNGLAGTTGVVAAGEVFDARDFLRSLAPAHLSFETESLPLPPR
jgi:hypothetical protein